MPPISSDISPQPVCGVCRAPVTIHETASRIACDRCLKTRGLMACRAALPVDGTPVIVAKRERTAA